MRFLAPLFLICLLASPVASLACGNLYNRKVPPMDSGKLDLEYLLKDSKGGAAYWTPGFATEELMLLLGQLKNKGYNNLSFKDQSDYALLQLKLDDKQEALKHLEELYAKYPKEYNIMANLGTAYEVTGNDEKALELLRKAVAMNPASHYDSEWIHLRILEEKLAGHQYDKIINLNIKDFSQWLLDKSYVFPREKDSLKLQIAYQLHERIGFIAPPNQIVGQLVFDFADLVAKTEVRDSANAFYDFAVKYDSALLPKANARKEVLKGEHKVVNDTFRWASIIWAIPLLAFAVLLAAWIRSIRKQKAAGTFED